MEENEFDLMNCLIEGNELDWTDFLYQFLVTRKVLFYLKECMKLKELKTTLFLSSNATVLIPQDQFLSVAAICDVQLYMAITDTTKSDRKY